MKRKERTIWQITKTDVKQRQGNTKVHSSKHKELCLLPHCQQCIRFVLNNIRIVSSFQKISNTWFLNWIQIIKHICIWLVFKIFKYSHTPSYFKCHFHRVRSPNKPAQVSFVFLFVGYWRYSSLLRVAPRRCILTQLIKKSCLYLVPTLIHAYKTRSWQAWTDTMESVGNMYRQTSTKKLVTSVNSWKQLYVPKPTVSLPHWVKVYEDI